MGDNSKTHLDEDTQLMIKVAKGDRNAYTKLYRKYLPILISYATSINWHDSSSEDIANEVFARLWQQRAKYQPTSTVKTYLFGFTRNIIREKKFDIQSIPINQSEEADYPIFPPREAFQADKYIEGKVNQAIDSLPAKQRLAIKLCYFDKLSISEAAKVTGDSYDTFRKRLYRAHQALVAILASFVE
jgi:RNA polymerase sigma-70 factor (ECF subfamily)